MDSESQKFRSQIEAYLQGRLAPEDEAAFEEAYLADPALLEELELTDKLRAGVRDTLKEAAVRPVPAGAFWGTPQFAVAASTVLTMFAVLSGLLWVENRALQQQIDGAAVPGTTRVLQLVAVRGETAMTVEAAAQDEWTVLLADPGFSDLVQFDATLTRAAGGETLWTARALAPGFDGMVPVGLPGAVLTAGDYVLELHASDTDVSAAQAETAAAGAAPIVRYRFSVAPR